MNYQWNLDVLYTAIDSEEFQEDYNRLDELIVSFDAESKKLLTASDKGKALVDVLMIDSELTLQVDRLLSYLFLRQATDTTDAAVANAINQLQLKVTETTAATTRIKKFVAELDNLEELLAEHDFLKEHEFMLKEIKEKAQYQLNEREEEIISKLYLNGGNNWSNLQEYLASTLEVDYKDEKTTLSGIRNLAYSDEAEVRKSAYEAEIAAYDKIKDAVAFSLNSIKGEVNTLCELRGYDSAIQRTLVNSRMSRATLDSLMSAIEAYLPRFQEYLKRKGEILGHQNGLPWYDLFAPVESSSQRFEITEARDFIIRHFRSFSADLADMVEEAFANEWIDFFPRPKKVGGAFCANLPFVKQSRVLANYDYSLSDVVTLAHELGHAYHGLNIQDHSILNTDYTMPVAETASTFCESIVMNAVMKDATKEEKIKLLESTIQDFTQIIVDIYSRYTFEETVFNARKSEFLFSADLEKAMLDAQNKAYGEGLDPQIRHPYMWICKSHYYSVGNSYYNFPYAFGGLFAKGLYAKYLEEGPAFVVKYKKLLHATTVNTVEEVAAMADIDISKRDFWDRSLDMVGELIDEFMQLTAGGKV